jgi:hypothetical protein
VYIVPAIIVAVSRSFLESPGVKLCDFETLLVDLDKMPSIEGSVVE